MKDDKINIEARLQKMKDFYTKAGEIIDNLPDTISEKHRKIVKEAILGDADLKNLMDGIDTHRPPRIFLIGRTGVGKSSLINALCGAYVAEVSNTKSCTEGANIYQCKEDQRVLMEILDTRGIAESESLNDKVTAEDMIIKQVNEFSPDVAVFMLNCTHRDDVDSDVLFLNKIAKKYKSVNNVDLPVVAVINKCDEMAPTRFKNPKDYPEAKFNNIREVVQYYKGIIVNNGLKIEDIIPVSSLIDWQTPDGLEVGPEAIKNLPKKDIDNIEIAFDGRYNIDKLLDALEEAIQDTGAQMGLRMAARLTDVVHRFANHLINLFSGISAGIALTPLPVSDLGILITLQSVLVILIAALSGRNLSFDNAGEFVFGLGGVATTGFILRTLSQQASKLLNVVWPGAGSTVSSGIAAIGTVAVGKSAVAYYVEEKDMKEVKKVFKQIRDEKKGNSHFKRNKKIKSI